MKRIKYLAFVCVGVFIGLLTLLHTNSTMRIALLLLFFGTLFQYCLLEIHLHKIEPLDSYLFQNHKQSTPEVDEAKVSMLLMQMLAFSKLCFANNRCVFSESTPLFATSTISLNELQRMKCCL